MSVAFVTANNQEESEVAKLDDARNDCNQLLSTSFSHFLFPGEEQVRGQSPRGFCDSHLNSIVPFFPPTCRCGCATALRDKLHLLFRGAGLVIHTDVCSQVMLSIIHHLSAFLFILKHTAVCFNHNDTYPLFTYVLYMAHNVLEENPKKTSTTRQNRFMLRLHECGLHICVLVYVDLS